MSKNCDHVKVSESIRPYLNQIANDLSSKHAAIMVGAGFSKNAKAINDSCSGFADWSELGDAFYEKTRGYTPQQEQDENAKGSIKYMNVLKLAEEVEAALGRPALNQLLQDKIPHNDYEPSELHVELMKLSWSDVFTTNYDTLLERACKSVFNRRYDVVVNKDDIIHSKKPRIIKLHGSFPSEKPFIITEEDYRRYPQDFSPFVNTVQQALLENTLCLIGFSGDDPNFLKWIGWIRDNLGNNNSPKMYLIGIFDLSDSQIKLLAKRNVNVVDMSECEGVGNNHYEGLKRFLDYIKSKNKKDNRLDWPSESSLMSFNTKKDKKEQITKLVDLWKGQRKKYPGWVILPEDRRSSLWAYTQPHLLKISEKDSFEAGYDLKYAYELLWRMEKCLCPIWDNQISFLESILNEYSNDEKISGMWIDIHVSVMRYYREQGLLDKWKEKDNKANKLLKFFTENQKARLFYERGLFALFSMNLTKLKSLLDEWTVGESLPFWKAKRASLMTEIGEVADAKNILEKSLQNIQLKLNLNSVKNDYALLSQEAYVLKLLGYVCQVLSFNVDGKNSTIDEIQQVKNYYKEEWEEKGKIDDSIQNKESLNGQILENRPFEDEWKDLYEKRKIKRKDEWDGYLKIIRWDVYKKEQEVYTDRLDQVRQYKCDPAGELKLFESNLTGMLVEQQKVTRELGFDIGYVYQSFHGISYDIESLKANNFLRFSEDAGIPFRISNCTFSTKIAEKTLLRICNNEPYWAMATMVRIGDNKTAGKIFNRNSIWKMKVSEVDSLINRYLSALDESKSEIISGNQMIMSNFGVLLSAVIPEILSRLCCKCSQESKDNLFDFLLSVYQSEYRSKYKAIKNLTKRLVNSIHPNERFHLINRLLDFSVSDELSIIDKYDFKNPFIFLNLSKDEMKGQEKIRIPCDKIESVICKVNDGNSDAREWASYTLYVLFTLGILEEGQINKFVSAIWSQVDKDGFPTDTGLRKFVFLKLPHPDGVNPQQLFKKYVKGTDFPIQGKGKSFTITDGYIQLCSEIIGARECVRWNKPEIKSLFNRIITWWDTDKNQLLTKSSEFFSIAGEFKKRFSSMIDVLSDVIIHLFPQDGWVKQKETLKRLIEELKNYGISSLQLRYACVAFNPESENDVLLSTCKMLSSSCEETVSYGLRSLWVVLDNPDIISKGGVSRIMIELAGMIYWRHRTNLAGTINLCSSFVENNFELFEGEVEKLVLSGLVSILDETKRESVEFDTDILLSIRVKSAKLAYRLYVLYDERGKPVPEEIKAWKCVCESEDEFAEIKNEWH